MSFAKEDEDLKDSELSKKDITMLQLLVNFQDSIEKNREDLKKINRTQQDLQKENSKFLDDARVSASATDGTWGESNEMLQQRPLPQ